MFKWFQNKFQLDTYEFGEDGWCKRIVSAPIQYIQPISTVKEISTAFKPYAIEEVRNMSRGWAKNDPTAFHCGVETPHAYHWINGNFCEGRVKLNGTRVRADKRWRP